MNKRMQYGVTLIELIVTIAIIALVASFAAPSLRDMMINNRLTATNNQMVSALHYMRGEAVKRVFSVSLCVRNDSGNACSNDSSVGLEQGWIIFTDCNENKVPDTGTLVCDIDGDGAPDTAEEILLDTPLQAEGMTIKPNNDPLEQGIRYRPDGNIADSGSLFLAFQNKNRYKISMAVITGRISSCKIPSDSTDC